ncbi:WD repeat-containing protein 89 isoform X1 [Latimeria chalumnae]|uniref:WD repeat-containing protein 89 isoform X1 n=1 Tax=Latimeria chalumnae TaxID=7897 RepID=UPI00313D76A9
MLALQIRMTSDDTSLNGFFSGAVCITALMEEIETHIANLRIAKRLSQTEDPTYLLGIDCLKSAAGASNELIAVSCSNLSIKLYNKETLSLVRQYDGHHSGLITGVRFAQTGGSLLFSASLDGTVKCWDVRSSRPDAIQTFKGYPSNVFTSFDINCDDVIICGGTEKVENDSFMVFWDARVATNAGITDVKQPLGVYSESHNDDITQICFHPTNPDVVASGSTDGLVNVFDIGKDNEDDALRATCNSDSSVSSVGWSGKDFNQIYCTTYDEGFSWWDLDRLHTEEPITLMNVCDTRETVKAESNSSLDYLIGGFYHEKAEMLILLAGTHLGKLHLLSCGTNGLRYMGSLQDGHSATVRSFYWDSAGGSLLTGGEDAQLLLWKQGAKETPPAKRDSKIISSVHRRVRVHNNKMYKSKES